MSEEKLSQIEPLWHVEHEVRAPTGPEQKRLDDTANKYGLDEYSRYVEIDGERYQIEPYPFWRPFTPRILWLHVVARIDVLRWFWATRHERDLWKY